uniref:Uncharacterized protein n=1 Tax=Amphimedon queenslandica TaxID=400682 RepID=A0A1X7SWW8_AMPQE
TTAGAYPGGVLRVLEHPPYGLAQKKLLGSSGLLHHYQASY